MTVKDFLKRLSIDDLDKMMTLHDGNGGWSNIGVQRSNNDIYILPENNSPFSEEKGDNTNHSSYPIENSLLKIIKEGER